MFDLKRLDQYIGTAKCDRYDVLREAKAEIIRLREELAAALKIQKKE
jgi:hypothetical protein